MEFLATNYDLDRMQETVYEAIAKASQAYDGLVYAADDASCIKSNIDRVSALLDTLYQMMGISIYDAYGGLRNPRDVKQDILDLNPQIVLSFEDFMKMSAQENLK